jgi:hypothetical protein
MNAIIKRAHKIRSEAAVKFGGKAGQYDMGIACKMAKQESGMKFAAGIGVIIITGGTIDDKAIMSADVIDGKIKSIFPVTVSGRKVNLVINIAGHQGIKDAITKVAEIKEKSKERALVDWIQNEGCDERGNYLPNPYHR